MEVPKRKERRAGKGGSTFMNGVQSTDFSRVWMSPKAQLKLVLSTPLFLFRLCLSSRALPFALCLCYAPRRVRLITKHEFRIKVARTLRQPGHQLRQLVGVAASSVAACVRRARARRDG